MNGVEYSRTSNGVLSAVKSKSSSVNGSRVQGYGVDRGQRGVTGYTHRGNGRWNSYEQERRYDRNAGSGNDDSGSLASRDSEGKRKSFRRLLSRFADKTSMVGVGYINSAKFLWARIIWCFLLLIAVGAMTLHLWYLINQYLEYPVVTKISLGYSDLRFPQVTFCNTNTLHRGKLDAYTGADELKALIRELKPENIAPDMFDPNWDPFVTTNQPPPDPPSGNSGDMQQPTEDPQQPTEGTQQPTGDTQQPNGDAQQPTGDTSQPPLRKRRKRFVDNYGSIDPTKYDPLAANDPRKDAPPPGSNEYDGEIDPERELDTVFKDLYMDLPKHVRSQLGHDIKDMLLSCSFNGRVCSSELFRLHQTTEYGNCWSLDNDKFKAMSPGPDGGLSLLWYLESSEYLSGVTTGYGARLLLHEPDSYPYPAQEGIFIPASMETSIGLKMTFIARANGSYGSCEWGDDFRSRYDVMYTRRSCQSFCVLEDVVNTCGCFDKEMEEFARKLNDTLRPCRQNEELRCMVDLENRYARMELSCDCGEPCRETKYGKTISQRQWPTDDYANILLLGVCEKNLEKCKNLKDMGNSRDLNYNFLRLNIYYEDLNYETIEEFPEIEVQQFLSDVGGAIGLWIGLSILSLCEVGQLLIELCDYGIHTAKKQSRYERKKLRRQERTKMSEVEGHGNNGYGPFPNGDTSYNDFSGINMTFNPRI
ncbi:amiloride-sensitive sodium channel subunit beta-2-like [Mya arenaria]|uniref:amiloride-sensitive sodium channel subunit beta-2-like n=1 Tax=Mya arenaria TaxID=6604 RepID=UPI0022E8D045|nr:amiloride-sensitive sodium channel subunit beta-2-like [Mya arenaria]XP_052775054.1 amiloride-sensitive sodium channel subunit beta-2-like [Mya arenaria]